MNRSKLCTTALIALMFSGINTFAALGHPLNDPPNNSVEAAKAIYLDNRLEEVDKKKDAAYTAQIIEQSDKGFHFQVYFLSGELKMDGWYTDETMSVPEGEFTFYYRSGQVESTGTYREGSKYGIWQCYYSNGEPRPERIYAYKPMMRANGLMK